MNSIRTKQLLKSILINGNNSFDVEKDKQITEDVIRFAKKMCELQKEECKRKATVTRGTYGSPFVTKQPRIDESSILRCKNVCDE